MAQEKYMDFAAQQYYDEKIKEYIKTADEKVLSDAKEYSDSLATNYDAAGTAATKVAELADGQVKTNTEAIAAAQSAADTAQAEVDALKAKVGTVPDGQTVMGVIQNIQENAYDDTELKGLIQTNTDDITALEGQVTTLVGEDTNKSVRTIANEELAKQLIAEGAKESLDTLSEIAAWIQSHPDDAAAMNQAIAALEALVGTLPEGVTATTIVGYIQEVVTAEKTRAEEVETGLETRLTALEGKVGEGFVAITNEEIDSLFA